MCKRPWPPPARSAGLFCKVRLGGFVDWIENTPGGVRTHAAKSEGLRFGSHILFLIKTTPGGIRTPAANKKGCVLRTPRYARAARARAEFVKLMPNRFGHPSRESFSSPSHIGINFTSQKLTPALRAGELKIEIGLPMTRLCTK